MSLVMLAFAMLAVIRHHANQPAPQKHRSSPRHPAPHALRNPRDPPHSNPPTQRRIQPAAIIACSLWRRSHQAAAQDDQVRQRKLLLC
jgi:hypothetical protein